MEKESSKIEKSSNKFEDDAMPHKCPFCPKVFPKLSRLREHIRSHTKEKPFKCNHCSFRTSSTCSLKLHTGIKHEDQSLPEQRPKFKCEFCTFKACRSSDLLVHMSKHTGERKFPCTSTHCGYSAKSRSDLKQHSIRAHCDERTFSCEVEGCSYTGKTVTDIRQHKTKHRNDRPFPCPQIGCDYKAKCRVALHAHVNFTHGKEWYKCSFPGCIFQTMRPSRLKRHMAVHVESFKCSFPNCKYRGRSKEALRSHELVRHEKTRPYICSFPQCNYGTATKSHLKDHLKSHSADRPFPCTFEGCNFRGKRKYHLERHQETHKKGPKFPCPISGCTYVGRYEGTQRVHVKTHEDIPDFRSCSESGCKFWSNDSNSFREHQKIHHRRRKLSCPFCSKFFSYKSMLELHSFIHTGEKPYKCVHCDYGCHDKISLMSHYERKHQGEKFSSDWLKPLVMCRYCNFTGTSDALGKHNALQHLKLVVNLQRIEMKTV